MLLKHMCQYCFAQNNRVEAHTKKDWCRANKDNTKKRIKAVKRQPVLPASIIIQNYQKQTKDRSVKF